MPIIFDPGPHTYTVHHKDGGTQDLVSISRLLKSVDPVDWEKKAAELDKKLKRQPGETAQLWGAKRDSGSDFHGIIQKIWTPPPPFEIVEEVFTEDGKKIAIDLKRLVPGKVYLELIVYDIFRLAGGTSDQVYVTPDCLYIKDWKTSDTIDVNADEGLLYPCHQLPACKFVKYSLQICLYGLMLEQVTGIPFSPEKSSILRVRPPSSAKPKKDWITCGEGQVIIHYKEIPIMDVREEAQALLNMRHRQITAPFG
ncbi:MAG: hypothetical protein ACRCWR_07005 [Saezia sp.]